MLPIRTIYLDRVNASTSLGTHLVPASILQADGANRRHLGVTFFVDFVTVG